MKEIIEHSMHTLELHRVLEMLASCAVSEEAKTVCRALRPQTDVDDVNLLQAETEAARHLIMIKGTPGFQDVKKRQ